MRTLLFEEFAAIGVAPEGNVGGMGDVKAPTSGSTGSGDAWPSLGTPSQGYTYTKKKRKKKTMKRRVKLYEEFIFEAEGNNPIDKELIDKVNSMKDFKSPQLKGVYLKDGHLDFIMTRGYSDANADKIWDATEKVGLTADQFSIHSSDIESQTDFEKYQHIA
jgi:hypothetical protein